MLNLLLARGRDRLETMDKTPRIAIPTEVRKYVFELFGILSITIMLISVHLFVFRTTKTVIK